MEVETFHILVRSYEKDAMTVLSLCTKILKDLRVRNMCTEKMACLRTKLTVQKRLKKTKCTLHSWAECLSL